MQPILRRFETTVLKDKNPPSDTSQIPTTATIDFFRQGATASTGTTILAGSSGSVSVYDPGQLVPGDNVKVNGEGVALDVTSVNTGSSPQSVTLDNSDINNVVIAAGARLVPQNGRPLTYKDGLGKAVTSTASQIAADSTGRAAGYLVALRYDYLISIPSRPSKLSIDAHGGVITLLSVLDFPSFQAAHDALPAAGGTVFVPAGTYTSTTRTAFTGLVVTKPFNLVGEACGPASSLSIIIHNMAGAKDIDAIFLDVLGRCALKNLFIQGPGEAGSGRGVRWYKPGTAAFMAGLTLDNVTVYRSPNLSFEFVCDGGSNNYVSKVEMIQCTANEAMSGGSLLLGGAGTNNNCFERCEFNGPGFGRYHNASSCIVTSASPNVSAQNLLDVHVGDVVSGMGIIVGTTVVSLNTSGSPHTMILSAPAIESFPVPDGTPLSFYRALSVESGQLPRGGVHLMRTSISRFSHCSFQGPSTSPALSTDMASNDLELRDCYREMIAVGTSVHSFIVNGMINLLIDGLYHQFHDEDSRLLKTGPSGLYMGRITNAQLIAEEWTSTDVVELSNATDELIIDNSMEINGIADRRDLVVSGAGAVLPTITSGAGVGVELKIPNGSDETFLLSGSATITKIEALRPKRRITLIITETAQMTDGANLKLSASIAGPNKTISLVCDGANWIEVARSTY